MRDLRKERIMDDKQSVRTVDVPPPSNVKPRIGENGLPVPTADEQLAELRAKKAAAKKTGGNGQKM
jgi:hypothetical protein